jgi:hypothetical protein
MDNKVGDKVHYSPQYYLKLPTKYENGIIKEVVDDEYVRVVFHCNDDWENYNKYTGALTPVRDLYHGWAVDVIKLTKRFDCYAKN